MEATATASTSLLGPSSTPTSLQGPASTSPERALKRKFEDALHVLDDATRPASPTESTQPPSKRLRPSGPSRSLYATLAKYGIKKEAKTPVQENRLQSLSKNAPHLVALLTRTATRARRANPFKSSPPPTTPLKSGNIASEYRPSSTSSFLQRLATYKLTTYANKPPAIDAVAAAKCGWVNDGKDRLVCGICNISWVVASTSGLNRDAANALVEKQRVQLVDMHKDGCPWKTGQCDASIYRVPLQTPLATARELKANAIKLNSAMKDVQIKHPLTAAQTQALENIIKSVKLLDTNSFPSSPPEDEISPAESISMAGPSSFSSSAPLLLGEPSSTAIITALFGWSIVPPPPPQQTRPTSISRASSLAPSSPQLSATPRRISRNSTPTPMSVSAPIRSGMHISRMSSLSRQVSSTSVVPPSATNSTLLHCVLCQRRVGLWAFLPPAAPSSSASANGEGGSEKEVQRRQFDVLKEHRSYCPYVVRSTTVPSLPIPPQQLSSSSTSLLGTPGELEGWRAVLSVVLRYGATQRQRLGINYNGRASGDFVRGNGGEGASEGGEGEKEVDAVAAMVEGVKTRGGRDLLKYVKGLLG